MRFFLPEIDSKDAAVILHPSTFNVVSFCKPVNQKGIHSQCREQNNIIHQTAFTTYSIS